MATIAKLVVELGLEDGAFQRGMENSSKSLDKWGRRMMGVGAIITGSLAAPIIAGSKAAWDQVNAVEQATLALRAYEKDASKVDAVLQGLLDYARSDMGVLFSREELFATAQSLKLYGAETENLVHYTEVLSRSVGLGLSDWDSLNTVIGRVGSTGRLTGQDFDYLTAAGFKLDESLRNTDITWEQLFEALDKGMPADALAGQADTIRGKTIRLQSALRGLGLAFLGVDADTSQFIEGGLGDTLMKGLEQATKLLKAAAPAVKKFGDTLAKSARRASRFADFIISLPQPVQTAILVVTALTGVALTLGGAFLVALSAILPGLTALAGVLGFLVSPIGLVIVAVAALAAGLVYAYTHFEGFREIVDSVAAVIRDVAVAAFEKLVEVFNKLKDAFDAGGWSEMFSTMGDMLMNGLSQLASLAWEGVQWLAQAFWDALPGMLSAGWSLIQSLADGAVNKWNEFTGWLGGLAADAAAWIGDTASTLWQKGVDLLIGLGEGATLQWGNLATWIGQRGAQAFTAVGNVTRTLWQKGVDLFIGLGEGAMEQWGNLRTWIANRPEQSKVAIGDVLKTLWRKGVDLFIGLGDGIQEQWGNLRDWLSGMGDRIVGAVGSLGSSLYNAGLAVMNGLWDGLKAGWGDITGWLSGLNPADWKGPERRDKKMLYKPGIWIMQGLGRGLDEGWDDVTRQLSSYTPSINGGLDAAHANRNGGTVINHNYFVTPEALKEMIEGGKFAREFAGELNMSEGVA